MKKIKQNKINQRLNKLFSLVFILFLFFIHFGCMNPEELEPDEPPEKIEPPEPPNVLLPEPEAEFRSYDHRWVQFDWSHVEGAQVYEIEIDTAPDFSHAWPEEASPPTEVRLAFYPPKTTYFFRVRAYNSSWIWYTYWSESRRFYLLPVGSDSVVLLEIIKNKNIAN